MFHRLYFRAEQDGSAKQTAVEMPDVRKIVNTQMTGHVSSTAAKNSDSARTIEEIG